MEEHEFQPKEWVLVRDTDEQYWRLGIYSHYVESNNFSYCCVGMSYMQCIPYEGNEHLLGTSKPAGAVKELYGWKVGDEVEVEFCGDGSWYKGKVVRINPQHTSIIDGESMPYRVKAKCFASAVGDEAWCAKRQLRKPEEKPEEEFKFGDKVRWYDEDIEEWRDGLYVMDEGTSCIPLLVYIPEDNDTTYLGRDEVRRA